MKKRAYKGPLVAAALFLFSQSVLAQGEASTLVLRLTRDFGYGGFNNDIEGLFSLHAEGPQDLRRVDFYIDDTLIAADPEPPYRVQFSTGEYSPGRRRLHAVGFTSSGTQIGSNEIVREFLTGEEAGGQVRGLVFPLLGIVAAIMLLTALVPAVFLRRKPEAGKYGISGGAVCPKCSLPFARSLFGLHIGARNLERCPHCNKWSWVRRASADDLRAADVRWKSEGSEIKGESEEGRRQRQIDASRYEN